MTTVVRSARFGQLSLALLLFLFAPAALAQDPGDVPTLTTDDVRPPTASIVSGPELDAMWQ